jgi:hypothetical protein
MGGGSLADVPELPEPLQFALTTMRPMDGVASGDDVLCLAGEAGDYLLYTAKPKAEVELKLPKSLPSLKATWINGSTGSTSVGPSLRRDGIQRVKFEQQVLWLHR